MTQKNAWRILGKGRSGASWSFVQTHWKMEFGFGRVTAKEPPKVLETRPLTGTLLGVERRDPRNSTQPAHSRAGFSSAPRAAESLARLLPDLRSCRVPRTFASEHQVSRAPAASLTCSYRCPRAGGNRTRNPPLRPAPLRPVAGRALWPRYRLGKRPEP